jgi:thymidine kinase
MNPFFNVYIGPMFGAKTTRLLADIDRLKYKRRNVIAFKPNIDKRYTHDKISSHNNGTIEAYCIDEAEEIFRIIETYNDIKVDTIAIDEAFMINNIDKVLIQCYRKGYNIIISSIQMDAEEQPFESIKNILPWATKVEVCPAVCTLCDEDAYFTEALFDIKNATLEEKIGGKDMYEPRCFKHYSTI